MLTRRGFGWLFCGAISLAVIGGTFAFAPLVTGGSSLLDMVEQREHNGGHPVQLDGTPLALPGEPEEPDPGVGEPPLVSGSFVNFESPQVKPLALSGDGAWLMATNTPNNSLLILDATGARLRVVREITVGLDPVAVAIQPNTNDRIVWSANHISDNVSIVDCLTGETLGVVEVGDEPANIVFDDAGTYAFVIIQGSPIIDPVSAVNSDIVQEGNVIVIDTATHAIVATQHLDCNTPRGAVYRNGKLYVTALFSGNNTTVVGTNSLLVASLFNQTKPIFDASPLAPYPDPHDDAPNFPDPENPKPSPLVHRIVTDAGSNGAWQQIIDVLSLPNGEPDPVMVQALAEQIDPDDPDLEGAEELLRETIDDAKNTDDNDLFVVDVTDPTSPQIESIVGNIGTTLTSLAVKPDTGALYVSNMRARNLVRLEPNLRGHIVDHEIVVIPNPSAPFAVADHKNLHQNVPGDFNDVSSVNAAARARSLANPLEIVFSDDATRAYVVALGPGRVGVLDTNPFTDGPFVIGRVDVGRGPRGLVLDSVRTRLYVMNRTDHSISVVNVTSDQPTVEHTLPLFNPEPDEVKDGRDFLYSTRFSNNFGSSCAVCHIDGHLDHLAWDLGDPGGAIQPGPPNVEESENNPYFNNNHPVKGPMVTQSLRGLDRHDPLHWRGDKPTFQDFNAAFDGLLGGSQLPVPDMDAYTDFIHTVNYSPNPYRKRDNTFRDPRALPGTQLYENLCNACHQVEHDGAFLFTDTQDGGMSLQGPPLFAQLQLVTQLRGIHKKFESDRLSGFGLVHDGREEREDNDHPLRTFLLQFFNNVGQSDELSAQVIAFVTAFPSNALPVTGWQVLLDGVVEVEDEADIGVMIGQHMLSPSGCDVVVKGVVAGQEHGLVLSSTDPAIVFTSDLNTKHTLADLFALAEAGTTLVFTAVPPGSGERIGIDQDEDGLPDGLDPCPQRHHEGSTDYDCDGDVDGDDADAFLACRNGPNLPMPDLSCFAMDIDGDKDVDQSDFAGFQRCITGEGNPIHPDCAE